MEHTGLTDPGSWVTEEERRLIDSYIEIRNSYGKSPMTDAAKRAAVTRNYLEAPQAVLGRQHFTTGCIHPLHPNSCGPIGKMMDTTGRQPFRF